MQQLQINPRWEGNIISLILLIHIWLFPLFHFSMTMLLQLGVWLTSQKVQPQVAKRLNESYPRVCMGNKTYHRKKESIEYKYLLLADDFLFQSFSMIWQRYHHLT